ncbi:MAG: hypothetical protein HZA82_05245, partial [Thaumarchaeota archaeon]|nr:hypothetical protein [Nitrososphaerota archaeon]
MNFVWLIAALILFYTTNLAFATQENPVYAAKPHFPESINIQENTKFSVKVSNTGDSFLSDIKPIIEVNPKSASGFVHIQASPSVTALWGGYSDMVYGTIYVDKDIPVERIFVSVSFTAKNSRGEMIPLANPENNASIKIEKDSSDKNTDSIFDLEKEKPNCSNSKVSLYGCSDTTTVKIDSPLKQFKSGTPSQQVTCSEGLELVIKSGNGYPMCVKPPTKSKLIQKGLAKSPIITEDGFVVSRPDLVLQIPLRIEGLNETQHVGQKIEFTVKFNGTKSHCSFYPSFHIENAEHETVWESNYILESCDPDTTPVHFEKEWKIDGNTPLGTPIINKTGSYTLFAEFENDIIQQDFWVKTPLRPENTVIINDKSFYFTTINETGYTASLEGKKIPFHNVDFILFPRPFSGGLP